jgi:DNA polymerase III subunit delta
MLYKSYLIEQNINNLDKNLFLFYGENIGLKNDFKKIIKFINRKSEILIFSQEEILKNFNLIYNEINNISLFDKNKLFIIEQTDDKILEILKELEPNIDKHKIYLFSEILDKKSKIRNYFEKSKNCGAVACYADNEIGLKKIILNKLKGYTGLSTYNINLILENCNLDRVKLNNEIEKIAIYFQDKNIKTEKLEILLDTKVNDNFSLLKDEALLGNKSKTNKLLSDTIIDSEKNIYYLSSINQRLNKINEIIYKSKEKGLEEAINTIRPPIFWKDKPNFISQTKKWSQKKIKTILEDTYNLEIKIKSNNLVDKNILIKKLLIDLCNLANA